MISYGVLGLPMAILCQIYEQGANFVPYDGFKCETWFYNDSTMKIKLLRISYDFLWLPMGSYDFLCLFYIKSTSKDQTVILTRVLTVNLELLGFY